MVEFEQLMQKVQAYRPGEDVGLLRRAYEFSAAEHRSQRRLSGEPYVSHPLAVANVLADLKLDVVCLAGGMLHDVVEDTSTTIDRVREAFGPEVARIVEGVTKISRLEALKPEERQAENLRKMILAMVDDIRVVLVKLADRLHNMRTLEHLPPEKRERIAAETLEIYAPIAHRLGMGKVRGELEDLAFRYLEPEAYEEVRTAVESRRKVNEEFLAEVRALVDAKMKEQRIPARVEGRIKRLYSIWQKLKRQRVTIEQVYDLLAVRIITDNVKNCYAALGVIHNTWRPVPGRIKDFIAIPRPNLYQSLHTSVIGPHGQPFEVQIRTEEMHRTAEQGIASHWKYKDGQPPAQQDEERFAWLRHLVEWQQDVRDSGEFLSTLKIDLYPEEVYTFTPKGKVIVLPRDATPIDFAYAIHTEVGHHCVGAKVNGRIVPLKSRLRNGDIVEISTQASHTPSRDWLAIVKTSKARNKIKHWINVAQRRQAVEIGRKLLEKEARKYDVVLKKISDEDYQRVARDHGCTTVEDLYAGQIRGAACALQAHSGAARRSGTAFAAYCRRQARPGSGARPGHSGPRTDRSDGLPRQVLQSHPRRGDHRLRDAREGNRRPFPRLPQRPEPDVRRRPAHRSRVGGAEVQPLSRQAHPVYGRPAGTPGRRDFGHQRRPLQHPEPRDAHRRRQGPHRSDAGHRGFGASREDHLFAAQDRRRLRS